jgi:DNA polymerase sigma
MTGIHCDINVNHQPGYWNSIMLGRYTTLCPHLSGLLLAIKRWSRPLGLNNPSRDVLGAPISFSSYAFALMTVGFLQVRWSSPKLPQLTALSKSTGAYCRTCKKT